MKKTLKTTQITHPRPILTCLWEVLYKPELLFGKFFGYIHRSSGQFPGTCLKGSQPLKRTFAGQMTPLERTFGQVNAPDKQPLPLIPWDFSDKGHENSKIQVPGRTLTLALHTHTCSAYAGTTPFASICLIPRNACRVRSSFSMSAKRTCWSPCSPNPMPGLTATLASLSRSFENSSDPSSR
jgi:hypothetical protein